MTGFQVESFSEISFPSPNTTMVRLSHFSQTISKSISCHTEHCGYTRNKVMTSESQPTTHIQSENKETTSFTYRVPLLTCLFQLNCTLGVFYRLKIPSCHSRNNGSSWCEIYIVCRMFSRIFSSYITCTTKGNKEHHHLNYISNRVTGNATVATILQIWVERIIHARNVSWP